MKDEIKIIVPDNYDMEADAQREITAMMKRESNSASEASAKRDTETKPVYKYETLDRYAGYGIIFLSGGLLAAFGWWLIISWPV